MNEFHCEHCCREMSFDDLIAHIAELRGNGLLRLEIHIRDLGRSDE